MQRATRCAALLFMCVVLASPVGVQAAALYLDTEHTDYGLGDTFIATVRIDNQDECLNAAQVLLTYPTDTLRAVDFSRGGSIFTLWVEEPVIDTDLGTVRFAGGIPGGYCGRIPGDPVLTNGLGKIVFTVIGADADTATIGISPRSEVYINDGQGTKAELSTDSRTLGIGPTPTLADNPWLSAVEADTIPPDPFVIQVESTRGVFGGRYYIVFSTVDKQSGLDHFELFERGKWIPITSPYQLKDQFLPDAIQVRAIDKAGNERFGEYNKDDAPPRQFSWRDGVPLGIALIIIFGAIFLLGTMTRYITRRKSDSKDTKQDEPVVENAHDETSDTHD